MMDTFAALALATDPPTRSVLDRKPDRKSALPITSCMWKMIIGQAICQLVISFAFYFGGSLLHGYNPNVEHDQKRLNTLVFNTLVWLQIFNEFKSRGLDNNLNIFEGITRNWLSIIKDMVMVGGQDLIIFVGGQAFRIVPLLTSAKEGHNLSRHRLAKQDNL
jgi:Ca2+-transporting ATPase